MDFQTPVFLPWIHIHISSSQQVCMMLRTDNDDIKFYYLKVLCLPCREDRNVASRFIHNMEEKQLAHNYSSSSSRRISWHVHSRAWFNRKGNYLTGMLYYINFRSIIMKHWTTLDPLIEHSRMDMFWRSQHLVPMLACTKHRYLIGTERCPFYCLSSSEHRSKSSIEIRKTNCTLLRLHSIIILRIATRNYRNHLEGMW